MTPGCAAAPTEDVDVTIRERIARWISPDLGKRADRYRYLITEIQYCARWLAEFEDVSKVLLHLQEEDVDYWRPPGTPGVATMPREISAFREMLRRSAST